MSGWRRRAAALVLVLTVAITGACESGQDPDLSPGPRGSGANTTSNTLGACPPGGPDATTPAAGCLDPAGNVVTP